jgi:hypothetical protein
MHSLRYFSSAVALISVMSARPALADINADGSRSIVEADHPVVESPRHRMVGMIMDLGVPDGVALGLVFRPQFDWLRLAAAGTYNGMAPGVRLGVTIDPIAFPIAPTLTVEGGHYWEGRLPMINDAPSLSYSYANFHFGLEAGNRATYRFFVRGGASWIEGSTANFQSTAGGGGPAIGNPSFNGWLAPSGKIGFAAYF